MFISENSMLLVLLCFMTLVGLMVAVKACLQLEIFQRYRTTSESLNDSVVQVSVVESTSPISIPDVQFERNCQSSNDGVIDIDFSLPPSYDEAVKMPSKSFRSSTNS